MTIEKNIKKHIDRPLMKVALSFAFLLMIIVYIPLAIIAYPFVTAWKCANIVANGVAKKPAIRSNTNLSASKWGDFVQDFTFWSKMEEE